MTKERDMHALILFMMTVSQMPGLQEHANRMAYFAKMRIDLSQRAAAAAKAEVKPNSNPCSIPLLNAQTGKAPVDPKMLTKIPEGQFHMLQVTPPAPPCENWGK